MAKTQLIVAIVFVLGAQLVAAAEKPNIVLITVDDLGYGDLGVYGHPVIESPNLDQLANDGMRLTQYYAPSGLCSPSRAGVLTGRTPYRTGIKSWIPEGSGIFLRSEEITLAELLKNEGYNTALIGKWHLNANLGSENEPQPMDQGFDNFYGHNAFQIPTNRNPTNIYRGREKLPPQEGYTADLYADASIEWLSEQSADTPFFLYLSMAEPHTTIENPADFNALYKRFTNGPIVPIPSGEAEPPKGKLIPRGPGEYYANITYMDHQLGRVLDQIDNLGFTDNTVVVFVSDNGPVTSDWIHWWEVNAYGSTGGLRGRKHGLYEGGIRVPAIVRYPGMVDAGSSSSEAIIGMDLYVTLAEIAGAKVPDDRILDGINVSDAWQGKALEERTLFWALDSVSDLEYAVRRGHWKLLLDRRGQARELYHLEQDPLELFDRLADEEDVQVLLQAHARQVMSTFSDRTDERRAE
ncbi:MAG: sulfatase-like hydrolase/transferase [Pseudomonadaceae bacterium]|nr:sulfatase-like hydrolase/transferase [Pseudomonadaceae bacterium]